MGTIVRNVTFVIKRRPYNIYFSIALWKGFFGA
jgi:hypothetical protein